MAEEWARLPTLLPMPVAEEVVHPISGWPLMASQIVWLWQPEEVEWGVETPTRSEERGDVPRELLGRVHLEWVEGPPPNSVEGPVVLLGMAMDKQAEWALLESAERGGLTFASTWGLEAAAAAVFGVEAVGEATALAAVLWGAEAEAGVRV